MNKQKSLEIGVWKTKIRNLRLDINDCLKMPIKSNKLISLMDQYANANEKIIFLLEEEYKKQQ